MYDSNNPVKLGKELDLAKEFTAPTYEEWRKQVDDELKGESFEKKLVTKTYEGINLQPIYTKNDIKGLPYINNLPGFFNYVRGNRASGYLGNSWLICQELPYGLAEDFNEALLYDIAKGQNSINLPLDTATKLGLDADYAKAGEVGDCGVSISAIRSISKAFEKIDLNKYPLFIDAGFSSLPIIMLLNAYLRDAGKSISKIKGSIVADPISFMLTHGDMPVSFEQAMEEMKMAVEWGKENAQHIRTIGASGLPFNSAGANAVQELAFTIASAVEYVNHMVDKGIDVPDAVNNIKFVFGVGPFFFMEIAKLRAAKLIWSDIAKEFGVNEKNMRMAIHARTSTFNQTVYDPYVNMLRTTTEAFSAVVGGIESLHSSPFDEAIASPDLFSRRIARNTQTILNEETHLNQIIDPAGGSYYVEKLTDEVAQAAWKLFQKIEAKGGMFEAVKSGFIQEEIEKTAAEKIKDYGKRKAVLVGTNMYANIKEEKLVKKEADLESIHKKRAEFLSTFRTSGNTKRHNEVLLRLQEMTDSKSKEIITIGSDAFLSGATIGEISRALRHNTSESTSVKKVKIFRAAEMFEELRDASKNYKKKTGANPKVFLAAMGPLKQHKGRTDFSRGFFETAGFEVLYTNGFKTTDEAVNAAVESKANAVVICSTDDTYSELVPPIVKGIKSKHAEMTVILAGYPKDQVEEHKKTGIDDFIYLGADTYSILSVLLKKIGAL